MGRHRLIPIANNTSPEQDDKLLPCFHPSGPLPMLVQTMKEFDYADKIKESCPSAFWPTGYPAPDSVPKSDERIVSGTGCCWWYVSANHAEIENCATAAANDEAFDNVDKRKESCPRASWPTGPPTPDQYPWRSS